MLEEEKKSKRRNYGIGLFIIGWIFVVIGILGFYYWSRPGMSMGLIIAIIICIPMIIIGFILVPIGIFLILHNRSKASKN